MKKVNFLLLTFMILSIKIMLVNAQDYSSVSTNINLDWEPIDSYTPPFYEGKALPSKEGNVKVIANVEVNTPAGSFDQSKLYYYWLLNDELSHTFSKTGGNIIYIPLSEFGITDTLKLMVYADNTQKILIGEKTLKLTPSDTLPILYRKNDNPILTYANAINKKYQEYKVNKGENFDVIAEPFYFSTRSSSSDSIDYSWSINNIPGNKNYSNIFNYTVPENAYRDFGISLKIINTTKSLQNSETTVNFIFDN